MTMKISEVQRGTVGQEVQKAKPARETPAEFGRLLAEEAGKITGAAGEISRGPELGTLSSAMPLQLVSVRNDFSNEYRQASLAVEGAIYRMEQLQAALQDPGGGLKQVGAAIDDLAAGAQALGQSVASLPENHQLRQLADELAVLSHVETVKYRRGDYL